MSRLFLFCLCLGLVAADVYLHNPRGSNNRNCRNDNNDRRRNGNRVFDSQNNDKGGYSCPRAYPFSADDNDGTARVNEYGDIISDDKNGRSVDTETFFYYAGTTIPLEWTSQHACGDNGNINCRVVLQYTCDTEAPDTMDSFLAARITNPYLRDGTPTRNNGNQRESEATNTIPEQKTNNNCCSEFDDQGDCVSTNCVLDGRYGYNEPHDWYSWCKARQRNKGLFTADQLDPNNNNRQRAIHTRQNPNGNRRGLECPEERDYYPYWVPTMWRDVAVGVPSAAVEECQLMVNQSQNLRDKCYCDMSEVANPQEPYAIDEGGCIQANGQWKCAGAWGLPAPECFAMPYTRDNHLGNTVLGYASNYNWTLPAIPDGLDQMRCYLRIRYNASTGDFPEDLDFRANCDPDDDECTRSPIYDRDNREEKSYVQYFNSDNDRVKLSMAVNTNQYARTFQDRTFAFDIKRWDADTLMCKKDIVNINVRGKRGNIVQSYPSVEYDFVPQDVLVEQDDCVHIQWIGSDYNPNRNPNNAEGGPPNPNNENEAKADRTNLIEMTGQNHNYGAHVNNQTNPFFSNLDGTINEDLVEYFAFLDQDTQSCLSIEELVAQGNNRAERERQVQNCGKLNSVPTPYFKGGVVKAKNIGSHFFMSTRNNNFSNRSQKLKIDVKNCAYNCGDNANPSNPNHPDHPDNPADPPPANDDDDDGSSSGDEGGLSDAGVAGVVVGSVVVLGAVGMFAAVKMGGSSGGLLSRGGGPARQNTAQSAPMKPNV